MSKPLIYERDVTTTREHIRPLGFQDIKRGSDIIEGGITEVKSVYPDYSHGGIDTRITKLPRYRTLPVDNLHLTRGC